MKGGTILDSHGALPPTTHDRLGRDSLSLPRSSRASATGGRGTGREHQPAPALRRSLFSAHPCAAARPDLSDARFVLVAATLATLAGLGCEASARRTQPREPTSAARSSPVGASEAAQPGLPAVPSATPASAAVRPAAALPSASAPPGSGKLESQDDPWPEPAAGDAPATGAKGGRAPAGGPDTDAPLRTGRCHAEQACSGVEPGRAGHARLSVELVAGKVVALDYRSECAPPIAYSGRRDGLGVEAAADDWLVVALTVTGVLPGRTPEQGYQPPTHEETRAFRIRTNAIEWTEPANRIATTGVCVWQ
jgi:hypothetical protein